MTILVGYHTCVRERSELLEEIKVRKSTAAESNGQRSTLSTPNIPSFPADFFIRYIIKSPRAFMLGRCDWLVEREIQFSNAAMILH
jgi:hypothetical protein